MMSIKTFTREGGDWIEKTNSPADWDESMVYRHHYVAYAIPGLTYAAEYCSKNIPNYRELFYEINSTNEAGTLYPLYKATFMPVPRANYYLGTIEHRKTVSMEDKIGYYRDVVKANDMIQTDTIVLDFRDETIILSSIFETETALAEFKASPLIKKVIVLTS